MFISIAVILSDEIMESPNYKILYFFFSFFLNNGMTSKAQQLKINDSKVTFAQVVETSVSVISNSPSQDYTQPRSQGLSSLPPLSLREDPGSRWSRVSQNLGGWRNVC